MRACCLPGTDWIKTWLNSNNNSYLVLKIYLQPTPELSVGLRGWPELSSNFKAFIRTTSLSLPAHTTQRTPPEFATLISMDSIEWRWGNNTETRKTKWILDPQKNVKPLFSSSCWKDGPKAWGTCWMLRCSRRTLNPGRGVICVWEYDGFPSSG